MQSTPLTRPMPAISPAQGAASRYMPCAASGAISRNGVPGSSSMRTRSRGRSLPRAVCLARAASPPPAAARSICSRRSSTSARIAAALAWNSALRGLRRVAILLMSRGFVLLDVLVDVLLKERRGPGRAARVLSGAVSGGLLLGEAELGLHLVANLELLELAGHRHREAAHELDVARHLVVRDLTLAERAHLVFGELLAGLGDDPRAQLFAEARVRPADPLHVLHLRVPVQELLDLARVDVLAAADHHVLDAADDVDVALGVHRREIAGVQPAVLVDRLGGARLVFPVAVHHAVAAGAELAGHARRDRRAGVRVDDLDLDVRLHGADGGHALVERRVGPALATDRAGLGHAVGNRHLGHVHVADDPLHHLGRARRAGHDAGAQAGQVELLEARMVELGDEHRRHAVQAGAVLGLHRLEHGQRVERVVRVDDAAAVRDAGQVAEHHAEAVVQRHRNAEPVRRREAHAFADEEAVVQDVAVRQRRALREARGAAGELDVDRVGGLQGLLHLGHARVGRVAAGQQIREALQAGLLLALAGHVDPDHAAQMRQPRRRELARHAMRMLRREFAQHAQVVAGLEARHRHQRAAADLVQRVFELRGAVRRVDVDQDQAGLRGRELHQHPLHVVVRPDADPLARRESALEQRAGEPGRLGRERSVAVAPLLVRAHQRVAFRLARSHRVEEVADRLLDQRHVGRAAVIALGKSGGGHAHVSLSGRRRGKRSRGRNPAPRRAVRVARLHPGASHLQSQWSQIMPTSAAPNAVTRRTGPGPTARAATPMAFVRAVAAAYARYGLRPDAALRHARIAPRELAQADARVTAAQFEALSAFAMQELDDEALGWFSRRLPWGSYGLLCRASVTAPTLGIALKRWCRQHRLLTDDVLLQLETGPAGARLQVAERRPLRHQREFCLVTLLRYLHGFACWAVDSRIALREAAFPFPAPPHAQVYPLLFPGPVRFDAEAASLAFDPRYLALPLVRDEAATRAMLQRALPLTRSEERRV